MARGLVAAVAVVVAAGLGGCGGEAEPAAPTTVPADVDRVVDIDMADIRFEPEKVEVVAGSAVAFRFHNRGRIVHEARFERGSEEGVRLTPGRSGVLVHRFDEPGPLVLGCYLPGHFEAGMKLALTVR